MPYCSQGRVQSLDSAVRDRALFSWFGVAKVVPAFCGYIGYEVGMPKRGGSVHVATIKTKYVGDRVYVSHLLRRSYREGGRVRHENLGNLSHLPETAISAICRVLAGETLVSAEDRFGIARSLPPRSSLTLPCATTLPSASTVTRPHTCSTSCRRWPLEKTVTPRSARRRMSSRISFMPAGTWSSAGLGKTCLWISRSAVY